MPVRAAAAAAGSFRRTRTPKNRGDSFKGDLASTLSSAVPEPEGTVDNSSTLWSKRQNRDRQPTSAAPDATSIPRGMPQPEARSRNEIPADEGPLARAVSRRRRSSYIEADAHGDTPGLLSLGSISSALHLDTDPDTVVRKGALQKRVRTHSTIQWVERHVTLTSECLLIRNDEEGDVREIIPLMDMTKVCRKWYRPNDEQSSFGKTLAADPRTPGSGFGLPARSPSEILSEDLPVTPTSVSGVEKDQEDAGLGGAAKTRSWRSILSLRTKQNSKGSAGSDDNNGEEKHNMFKVVRVLVVAVIVGGGVRHDSHQDAYRGSVSR